MPRPSRVGPTHASGNPSVSPQCRGWSRPTGTVTNRASRWRHTGLDRLVAGWTISEGAGVRKPHRQIFELAAAAAGVPLSESGWMVGDHAEFDVGGGAAAGLRTAWVSRGFRWPAGLAYRPEVTGATGATTLRQIIG